MLEDVLEFLKPLNTELLDIDKRESLSTQVITGFTEMTDQQVVVIFGVEEDRNAINNEGCAKAPDEIRKKLYSLKTGNFTGQILDLGNIVNGYTVEDTYYAVSSVASTLLKNNLCFIILGGGQDITYSQYRAYELIEQSVNLVQVDCDFDLGELDESLHSKSYLGKIVLHQPNYLFNFSNIGYQSYFTGSQSVNLMEQMFFDTYRLGWVRQHMEEVEPVIRNADMLTFDVSSVRQSDAPGNGNATPNGFYAEEACQIARYAGFCDKLSSIGFYEINPLKETNGHTSHLAAQMVWYFLEGYSARKKDLPVSTLNGFLKYRVAPKNIDYEIVFYKSPRSEKWWMEIPYTDEDNKFKRHHIVPCSILDYHQACNEEIPERWWQTYKKLF